MDKIVPNQETKHYVTPDRAFVSTPLDFIKSVRDKYQGKDVTWGDFPSVIKEILRDMDNLDESRAALLRVIVNINYDMYMKTSADGLTTPAEAAQPKWWEFWKSFGL
jgi:hypothetical protein